MNLKKKLMKLRESVVKKEKQQNEINDEKRKKSTEDFFEQVMQRLMTKFENNPLEESIEISFHPQENKDLDLIRKLYETESIDENYLNYLCQQNGIDLNIDKSDVWYPDFYFTVNFNKKESNDMLTLK